MNLILLGAPGAGKGDRSGMGFTIMESFMTSFEVNSLPGKGTSVHLRRKIKQRQ